VADMMKKIKSDVDSGLHGEWKKTYKELCKAINNAERAEEDISKETMEVGQSGVWGSVAKCKIAIIV
jgi:hypothetical protein